MYMLSIGLVYLSLGIALRLLFRLQPQSYKPSKAARDIGNHLVIFGGFNLILFILGLWKGELHLHLQFISIASVAVFLILVLAALPKLFTNGQKDS